MTIAKGAIFLAAVAVAATILLARRSTTWRWPERVAALLTPALLLVCLGESAVRISLAERWVWNEARLARTFGLYNGIALYPGRDVTGPILGTLHTPLSHILYWPATLAPNVLSAVRAGVGLSVALVVCALLTISFMAAPASPLKLRRLVHIGFTLGLFWLGLLRSTMASCIFIIHGDPVAVASSTVAGGLLCGRSISARRIWIAAFFAVLAPLAKQTFVTVPLALSLFLFAAGGWKQLRIFCLGLCTWGLLLGAALLRAFGPARNIVFNVVTLSTGRPPHKALVGLPRTRHGLHVALLSLFHTLQSGTTSIDTLPVVTFAILLAFLFLLVAWVFVLRRSDPEAWPLDIHTLASRHRWLVFAVIAVVMLPLLSKATLTDGAGQNHLAVADFFLALAIAMSYLGFHSHAAHRLSSSMPHLFVFGLLAALVPFTALDLKPLLTSGDRRAYEHVMVSHGDLTAQAAAFSLAHPRVAYFPSNPLSSFFSERRFYSFDFAVRDREIAGYPLATASFLSGIPSDAQLIAVDFYVCPYSDSLTKMLDSGWTREQNSELPDFTVFRRNEPRSIQSSHFLEPSRNTFQNRY